MEKDNSQLPLKYEGVDPEEIILKLKEILKYLENKKIQDQNGKKLSLNDICRN